MARPAYSDDQREALEARIREAALALFGEVGYRGASLRAIGSRVGMSATALYRYYDNKDTLFAALRAFGFETLRERLEEARENANTPQLALRQTVRAYLDFAMAEPELYRLMYELDQEDVKDTLPLVRAARRAAFAEAEALVQRAIDERGLDVDANEIVHLLWMSVHGLAALALAGQLDLGKRFEALVEPVIRQALALLDAAPLQPPNEDTSHE